MVINKHSTEHNTNSGIVCVASTIYFRIFFLSLESDRRTVFIALTVISLVGTVLFFLIRKPDSENVLGEDESSDDQDLDVNE